MVSTDYDPHNPWTEVLETLTCAKCDFAIPAHLGERWNQMPIEAAREKWQRVYRDGSSTADDDEDDDG